MELRINKKFPERPERNKIEALKAIGCATLSVELKHGSGIMDSSMIGPKTCRSGQIIGGPAITLQFMPIREDYYKDTAEYQNVEEQLHRHALYLAEKGDVVVVDAKGNLRSGVFGEMMLTYFMGKGGEGVVIDGCIRDSKSALETGLGIWSRGFTPNYHIQTDIFPFSVNEPISCGGKLVFPGDIIVADDDGVVIVPIPEPVKLRKVTPKPIVVPSLLIPIPAAGNPVKLAPEIAGRAPVSCPAGILVKPSAEPK